MKSFSVFENKSIAEILYDEEILKGVYRVAQTVAEDLQLITGRKPRLLSDIGDVLSERVIIFATPGHSRLLDSLADRKLINLKPLKDKRECYMMQIIDNPFPDSPDIKQALVIAGSDKRGTIYGMFRLSEMCGVSPLVFWGDAAPEQKENVLLKLDGIVISKEPSVKYRGFFINDEWPAFGKWCHQHYEGFTSKVYDKVFQFLLRMKGNYLWPAMWNASFSEDGPGLENAKLADEYGVVMGASHHEPMCRAGIEWQQQYKKYGKDNTWSFITNSKAITQFWKDGILRNKDFENVITIGMRGESDSHLLGENSTVQDNVNLLKKAITVQNKLIKENINPKLKEVPRMFAIYKEVEDFYFGVDGCGGLKGWKELEDVILLFSEDNHGNLRAIPEPGEKRHSGGYGIYYHFDYHGSPYSYEWLNHINPVRAWEQLTMAYEHGIRDMWIVNVGDVKGNEYPLNYFMDLAYDYDKWGISNQDSFTEYTAKWLDMQFGDAFYAEHKKQITEILDEYIKWSSLRIPESFNPGLFKNNYGELDNACASVAAVMTQAAALRDVLPPHTLTAYDSMVYYPVMAFFTSIQINLTAGQNQEHAKRGSLIANHYAAQLEHVIPKDRLYVNKFHAFQGGKWNHMMESGHMCLRFWCDNDWTYPTVQRVLPIPHAKIIVSFRGYSAYNVGHYWQDGTPVTNTEMTRPDVDEIIIDIDSRGDVDFDYKIKCDKPWLKFSKTSGKSLLKEAPRISVTAKCDRKQLKAIETAAVQIDFTFKDGTNTTAYMNVKASGRSYSKYAGAFLEAQDYISIPADCYAESVDVKDAGWRVIKRLGRTGNAIKSFPVTKNYLKARNRPYVRYDFVTMQDGEYTITFYLSPRNPSVKGGAIKGCYSVNDKPCVMFDAVAPGFIPWHTDEDWSRGATDNIRRVSVTASLSKGLNRLKFFAVYPNVILEDIVIYPKDIPILDTYLAPPASYRIMKK